MNDLFTPPITPKILRPHQAKAMDMLRQSLGMGYKHVVLQAPTGFGKTLVAAKIIQGAYEKGNRVIFTAPAISLIDQSVEAFEAEGIFDIGVMQAQHPRTDPLARVQVASVQTLVRREIPEAALVIVDECHQRFKKIEQMMKDRPDIVFIGLTATPWAKGMGLLWDDLVVPTTIKALIEQEYLSKFRVLAPDVPDLSEVKAQGGDYNEGQAAQVMQGKALMASVVETWLTQGEDRPTLLFGVNCAHAEALCEAFKDAGVASAYVDAFTDNIERNLIERQFRAREIKVVCSVRTLTTGVDWPVSCIIDAAPTKSEILHVQKIGRGLRIQDGSEDLLILDHAGNTLRLGLVTDIHSTALDASKPGERAAGRLKTQKLPKPCARCETLHTGRYCPSCGHERKPVSGVDTIDGELVEVGETRKAPTKSDKQNFWSMALTVDDQRGKGGRMANALYKRKFGVWPKELSDRRIEPDQAFRNYVKSCDIAYANRKNKQGAL
ncbi:Helicase conserved C-terminal domain-containing protein [Roseovarius tolerans]|uniref:Helicase conserved C-terminal domain-containing protein n=1 Tax=Roseovarius tolerans TaxID=74031 RepID=A0A1H8IMA7_9RHOB|nr:DEAD/DEAH box helicase [Roseovarius tolerans]SEN69833.1 Helicase conserved C-terminal domain-containing protein [Roseovarius tolerans]